MPSLDLWPDDAGPSVRFLSRMLSALLAGSVALVAVYQVVDRALGTNDNWAPTAGIVSLLGWFVWRGATRPLRAPDLLIMVAACLVDLAEAALSDATALNLSTTVLSSLFVVAAPSVLRRRPAVVIGVAFVVLLGLAQALLAGQVGRQILDVAVINVAFVFTVMVLIDLLHRAARVNDRLHDQLRAAQVSARQALTRQRTEDRAQRLIHDEVITALRVVADRSVSDPALVRVTCRDAVAAVRAFGEPT